MIQNTGIEEARVAQRTIVIEETGGDDATATATTSEAETQTRAVTQGCHWLVMGIIVSGVIIRTVGS